MASHAYIPRINIGGNFCGHDPASPVFNLAKPAKKGKGGIPRVLTLCMERLTDYYYRPRRVIPTLDLANGSDRQQRSERREACVLLLGALLKRTDVTSLRVGVPTQEGFMSYTVDYIAKDTGMSLKRVERALRDLKAANLLTVSQPRQLLPDGSWKGLAAVKAISKHLFGVFGLGSMLRKERDKASKRLKKKALEWEQGVNRTPPTRTGKARFGLFLGALAGNLDGSTRKKNQPKAAADPPDLEHRKQLMLTALEFMKDNPDWDSDKCREEAAKQLSGTRSA